MKKALVFVLILTVISSIFVVSAFAESGDVSLDASSDESGEFAESTDSTDETSDETSKDGVVSFDFSVERIPVALKHMAVGMIGVLIVLSLIATVVFILNKVFKK